MLYLLQHYLYLEKLLTPCVHVTLMNVMDSWSLGKHGFDWVFFIFILLAVLYTFLDNISFHVLLRL